MTDSLVPRLRAAIEETAQVAKNACSYSREMAEIGPWDTWTLERTGPEDEGRRYQVWAQIDGSAMVRRQTMVEMPMFFDRFGLHIARHDPAAVLRRCQADLEIVNAAEAYSTGVAHGDMGEWVFYNVLHQMALGYGLEVEQ